MSVRVLLSDMPERASNCRRPRTARREMAAQLREEIGVHATARRGPKPCLDIFHLLVMRYAFYSSQLLMHRPTRCRVEPWLKISFRTEHLVLGNWPRLFLATGTGLSHARLHEVASAIAAVAA